MKCIVLGSSGGVPALNDACASYLVQSNGKNILIDCGSGALSALQEHIKPEELDLVIITHWHYDHISDLPLLGYVYQVREKLGLSCEVDLWAPEIPPECMPLVDQNYFNYSEISKPMIRSYGPDWNIDISFTLGDHDLESIAILIESEGEAFGFTGDTRYKEDLVEFFSTQYPLVLVCDSTHIESTKNDSGHMSAKEAATLGEKVKAVVTLLSHFWYQIPRSKYLKEAGMISSRVDLACQGQILMFEKLEKIEDES